MARSATVGIPKGRRLPLLLGMYNAAGLASAQWLDYLVEPGTQPGHLALVPS
jgi:hypothetical protein